MSTEKQSQTNNQSQPRSWSTTVVLLGFLIALTGSALGQCAAEKKLDTLLERTRPCQK